MNRFLIVLLLVSGFLRAQTSIAVLDFDGKNLSSEDASALTDRLRIELFNTKIFIVTERNKMDEILNEQGFQLSGCTSNECIVEMGQLIGVQQIVAGSIMRIGNVYSIAARTISVENGKIVSTAVFDHEGQIGDLLKFGMHDVAAQLAGQSGSEISAASGSVIDQDGLLLDEDVLLNVLRSHFADGYFVTPNIPAKKEKNARSSCQVSDDEKILALIDATVMGNAKNCLLFGQSGIYIRNDWSGKTPGRLYCSYKDFVNLEIGTDGKFEATIGNMAFNTAGAYMKRDAVKELLLDAQAVLSGK